MTSLGTNRATIHVSEPSTLVLASSSPTDEEPAQAARPRDQLSLYLAECRALVLDEIQAVIPSRHSRTNLYDLMLEYPLRLGKGFRPSLCIAVCRALGGRLEEVVRTAAVLELYHNAFLIHDAVE